MKINEKKIIQEMHDSIKQNKTKKELIWKNQKLCKEKIQ